MITYPPRADQKGFTFTHIEYIPVDSDFYTGVSLFCKESHGSSEYEVVKVRKHKKDRVVRGEVIAKKGDFYLPNARDWGTYGWSYPSEELARVKINELLAVEDDDEHK